MRQSNQKIEYVSIHSLKPYPRAVTARHRSTKLPRRSNALALSILYSRQPITEDKIRCPPGNRVQAVHSTMHDYIASDRIDPTKVTL